MAYQPTFGNTTIDPALILKAWAKSTWDFGKKESYFNKFMGHGRDSIIQIQEDLSRGKGTSIEVSLLMPLNGAGVIEDKTFEGKEEKMNYRSCTVYLSRVRNAVRLAGRFGWQPLMKHFGKILSRGGKLTQGELRILNDSGVIADIGLDTASGYDKNRGYGSSLPVLKQLDWLGNKSMIPFQKCDTICRMSTALAAYEKAIGEGKSRTQALEYAKKVNRDANFSYGVEDAPNLMRRTSTFSKVGLQFMKYPLKELEVIADFLPQNKKTTFKQKAAFWIPYFFACGLMGFIPFFDWGDDKLSKNFNLFPKDFLQKMIIQGTQEIFGKDSETGRMVGKVIMYGAPALANVDVSKRTGLASMLPQDTISLLFGATGSTIWGTGTNLAQGN